MVSIGLTGWGTMIPIYNEKVSPRDKLRAGTKSA